VKLATGGQRSDGNCSGNASERAIGEDLGGDDPDRWGPSLNDQSGKMIMGHFSCGVGWMVL
jgi:hypothetical protein